MNAMIETMKQVAKEMIVTKGMEFTINKLSGEFGTDFTRILLADIALDYGNIEAAEGALRNLTI